MPGFVAETQNPGSEGSIAVEIQGFPLGTDNRSPETDVPSGAARELVNVDVYRGGDVHRRVGYSLVSGFSGGHSLWSPPELDYALFIKNGSIYKLTQYGVTTDLGVAVSPTARMSWCWYNDIVYYTNGLNTGYLVGDTRHPWGLPLPPMPGLTAVPGTLPAGEYTVTVVNVSTTGEESGAPMGVVITLTDNQGIQLTTVPFPGITAVDIYATETNGDQFYKVGSATPGSTYVINKGVRGKLLGTQFGIPPWAGSIVQALHGRLYIARDRTVWFTDPLRPNMIFPRTNFLMFESPVTMLAPVVDGLYVGTKKRTYWLNGNDPTQFKQNLTQPFGVVKGSAVQIPGDWYITDQVWPNQGYAWSWRNNEGVLCIGRLEGFVQKINQPLITLTDYEEAASVPVRREGLRQVLTSLWNPSDNAVGFGDSVTAEVNTNNL